MKPRVKAGIPPVGAPQSAAAAEIAETIQQNSIANGQTPTAPPEKKPEGAPTRKERRKKIKEIEAAKVKARSGPKQPRTGKAKQPELAGMPEPSGSGKIAREYLEILEAIEQKITAKGDKMQALVNSMKKAKRTSVQVDGYTFNLKHRGPEDRITVNKPKA